MATTLAVGLNANNRPEYLLEVLRSWHVAFSFTMWPTAAILRNEPGDQAGKCHDYGGVFEWGVVQNTERLGVLRNPWHTMEHDLLPLEPDLMVLAEDDTVVARDALACLMAMHHTAQEQPGWDPDRTFYCLNQRWARPLVDDEHPDDVLCPGPQFYPSVWACTPAMWSEVLGPTWDHDYSHRGWDWNIQLRLMGEHGLRVMCPAVSRSNHIGVEGGAHMTPELAPEAVAHTFNAELAHRRFRYQEA